MRNLASTESGERALTASASHERAVVRMYRGAVALYAGVGGLVVVVLGNVFGGAGATHKAAVVGAGSLVFAGLLMGAMAAPHLMRFGRRFAVPALASFAIAGIAGLIGVAEIFESFFLDSTALETWGKWAVRAAGGFAVLGGVFLKLAQRSDPDRVTPRDA
jgi:formate-dependent nitrite reductase membrane component NrfD